MTEPGTVSSRDRTFVHISDVIEFWRHQDVDWLRASRLGWGEPFCFACGWLPRVIDGKPGSWEMAGKWLDKAHLQDHVVSGDDSARNLVMMCHLCHSIMPEFDDRDLALAWVRDRPRAPSLWQAFTDAYCDSWQITVSRRTLHRLRGDYNRILVENIAETSQTGSPEVVTWLADQAW